MRNKWFFFFLRKAISQRKGRFIISSAAVLLAVSVVTALFTLSSGVGEKIGNELKQYGANMIVTDRGGEEIDPGVAEGVRAISPYIRDAANQVYGSAMIENMVVEVIAMEPGKMTGFRIQGAPPGRDDEIMVGANLKDRIGAKTGMGLKFADGGAYVVTGIFEKGSEEDSAIIMTIEAARALLGTDGISAILLNADAKYLDDVKRRISAEYPSLDVKTVRQVAVAEERILRRMQLLMLIVTVVVVFSSMIALGSTMSANVIERTEEIGLMKAIGATGGDIRNFFISEAALAGFAGALGGYVCGVIAAETVSRAAFGSYVAIEPSFVMAAIVMGVCFSVFSTFLPVRDAMRFVPARILRGE